MVHVNQDFELGGCIFFVSVGVLAEVPFAGSVETSLTVDFAHIVGTFGVAVEDGNSAIWEGTAPCDPPKVDMFAKHGA